MKTNGCRQRPNGQNANKILCTCGKPGAVYGEGWLKGLCATCADVKRESVKV